LDASVVIAVLFPLPELRAGVALGVHLELEHRGDAVQS
jgi:hypothetical protein